MQGSQEYYDGYLDAHRLVRTDDVADAHGSTIDGETLAAAYMYLYGKAASG